MAKSRFLKYAMHCYCWSEIDQHSIASYASRHVMYQVTTNPLSISKTKTWLDPQTRTTRLLIFLCLYLKYDLPFHPCFSKYHDWLKLFLVLFFIILSTTCLVLYQMSKLSLLAARSIPTVLLQICFEKVFL